jgi:hypothetical protein
VSLVLPFRSPNDVVVDVPDDIPAGVTHAITRAVNRVMHHIAGVWRMTVRRSTERGRWRIELSGATGRHVWTIASPCEDLAELIADKLRSYIEAATARFQSRTFPALNPPADRGTRR